jgi:hypothetical protein
MRRMHKERERCSSGVSSQSPVALVLGTIIHDMWTLSTNKSHS